MDRIRRHLSFANVVSVLALFIALGGTAWGLAKNSVGSKQIRNGSVKKVDLHKHAVTHAKVAKNAIGTNNVRDGSLGASDVNNTIQLALTSPCPAGQAITSITQQGSPNCSLIPGSVSLGALTSTVTALEGQVAALCGAIRSQIDTNFDALDSANLPVAGLPGLPVTLPNLANDLPACP
jgi:hypothetical protein